MVIDRDGGSDNICTALFMIWTIVCVALSKDVHLFVLSDLLRVMRKQCKQCYLYVFFFLLWDKKGWA